MGDKNESDKALDMVAEMFFRWKSECPDFYEQWMKEHTKTHESQFGKLTFIVTDLMPNDKILILP